MESASINSSMANNSTANTIQEAPKAAVAKPAESTPPVSQNKVQEEQSAPPRLDFTEDQNTGKNIQTVA